MTLSQVKSLPAREQLEYCYFVDIGKIANSDPDVLAYVAKIKAMWGEAYRQAKP